MLIYFDENHSISFFAVYTVLFLILWNVENLIGVTKNYDKWLHSSVNFWFILPGGILQALMGLCFYRVLVFENASRYGLSVLQPIIQIVVSFILLDFIYYLYHVVMHRLKLLWRIHAVHHSDSILNVSTSLREHPFETVIRLGLYMISVCILGPFIWIVLLHQFIQVIGKIIIHSNFRLPDKIDLLLSYLIVTPNMHHVHHHHQRPFTDSNYGDLFSIWDRLFGTFKYLSKNEVIFGLDRINKKKSKSINKLILIDIDEEGNLE